MSTTTISFEVDADLAQAYASASAEQKQKLHLLLGLGLREMTHQSTKPLKQVMDEVGAEAKDRGLTPEILDSLLHEQ